jgi:hypothetical protein
MLESDLQKESCSRSKIIVVNRSNKARSSLLNDPKTVNPRGSTAGVDAWEVGGVLGDVTYSSKNVNNIFFSLYRLKISSSLSLPLSLSPFFLFFIFFFQHVNIQVQCST